jgi:hypothetical protein
MRVSMKAKTHQSRNVSVAMMPDKTTAGVLIRNNAGELLHTTKLVNATFHGAVRYARAYIRRNQNKVFNVA